MEVHGWSGYLKSKGENTSVENYDIKDNGYCITYKPWYFCKKLKILWLLNLCQIVDTIFSNRKKFVFICFLWIQKYWNWSFPSNHSILGPLLCLINWYWAHSCTALPCCTMNFTAGQLPLSSSEYLAVPLHFKTISVIKSFKLLIRFPCTHKKNRKMCRLCLGT